MGSQPDNQDASPARLRRIAVLLVGIILIPLWQLTFWRAAEDGGLAKSLGTEYRQKAASGLHDESRFLYFYHHLGLFPLATTHDKLIDTPEGARRVLERRPETLRTEWGHTIRFGDRGRAMLFLPDVWLSGSTAWDRLSVVPAHYLLFTGALMALFAACWWAGAPLLGAVLVALAGSNPFQLYETYLNNNLFSWPISIGLLCLALCLPLLGLRRAPGWYVWLCPLAAGLVLAASRQIRSEPALMAVGVLLALLTIPRTPWLKRLALAGVLLAGMCGGQAGFNAYFDHKIAEANQVVRQLGQEPYNGPIKAYHNLWHPIWCGLGDFDTKYGHQWRDQAAFESSLPILKSRYGINPPPWNGELVFGNWFWDRQRRYYRSPINIPEHELVVKGKVLADIAADPLWYGEILLKRAWRVLTQLTPLRLAVGPWWLWLPNLGYLFLPLLALLIFKRD